MQIKTGCKIKGPHIAEVLSNISISDDTGKITFKNKTIAENAFPGQFVSILCEDLLLRRPFSVANAKDDTFEVIYKIKGKGTQYISGLKCGDSADIIGPLGKGFNPENKNSLLIGCGVGIAPIVFLSNLLTKAGIIHTSIASTQTNLNLNYHCEKEQSSDAAICNNQIIITEDGSAGLKGRLDNHLENIIRDVKPEKIYTCGPTGAMAYVCNIAEKHNIPAEVALERDFACGTGVCMGCVVQIKENDKIINKRICKDGPVFSGNEVVW